MPTSNELYNKSKDLAYYLCERDNKDPEDFYETFDRDAALSYDYFGTSNYEDAFPRTYNWEDYIDYALSIVLFLEDC